MQSKTPLFVRRERANTLTKFDVNNNFSAFLLVITGCFQIGSKNHVLWEERLSQKVRTLGYHQSGLVSISRLGVICGLSFWFSTLCR